MRIVKYLIFTLVAIAICACSKDNDEFAEADFSVLGIDKITVNNTVYDIKDDLLLDANGDKNIVVSGTQMTKSTKHYIVEYAVIPKTKDAPVVSVATSYSDVAVVVSSGTTADGIPYIVVDINRTGYKESVTYKFYFAKMVSGNN